MSQPDRSALFAGSSDQATICNPIAAAFAAHAGDVLDLTVSNPTRADLPYAEAELRAALSEHGLTHYAAAPLGTDDARAAVAAELGCDAGNVALTASTSEAYRYLFELLCEPGDTVLVPRPGYPLLEQLARFSHVQTRSYTTYYDGEWSLDRQSVTAQLDETSRAIVLVSPNNPTGAMTRRDDLDFLRGLAIPVISDEVFAPYLLDPAADAAHSLRDAPVSLGFSLGGLSKRAGLPQLKLGWLVASGDPQLCAEAMGRLSWIADTWLSVGTPVQVAAGEILRASAITRAAIQTRLRENLSIAAAAFADSAVTVPRVEGGWYLPLRLPQTRTDSDWVLHLLSEHAVKVHPGWFYDLCNGTWIVASLLAPSAVFAPAISAIAAAVATECNQI